MASRFSSKPPYRSAVLTNLPEARKSEPALVFTSRAQAEEIINGWNRAATCNAEFGSINIWRTQDGRLRAHFLRFCEVVSEVSIKPGQRTEPLFAFVDSILTIGALEGAEGFPQ